MADKEASKSNQTHPKVNQKDLEVEFDKLAAFLFDLYKELKAKEAK